jgi:hypothetical protein
MKSKIRHNRLSLSLFEFLKLDIFLDFFNFDVGYLFITLFLILKL